MSADLSKPHTPDVMAKVEGEGADEFKIISHLRQLQKNGMDLSSIDKELDRQIARRLLSRIQTPSGETRSRL